MFRRFREHANGRGKKYQIFYNDRVIQIVTKMIGKDVEKIFAAASATGSTIEFSDRTTLNLLINSLLKIHPEAVDQMNKNCLETNKTKLESAMILTKNISEGTISETEFLKEIRTCLKPYEMITLCEVKKVKDTIADKTKERKIQLANGKLLNLEDQFKDLTLAETYRMRTVLRDSPDRCLELAYRMAHYYGDTSIGTVAAWVELVKEEYIISPEVSKTVF